MRFIYILVLIFTVASCSNKEPILLRDYVLETTAQDWAFNANEHELCTGLKSFRNQEVRSAAYMELLKRGIDTKECYALDGYELTPTFNIPEEIK